MKRWTLSRTAMREDRDTWRLRAEEAEEVVGTLQLQNERIAGGGPMKRWTLSLTTSQMDCLWLLMADAYEAQRAIAEAEEYDESLYWVSDALGALAELVHLDEAVEAAVCYGPE